MMDGFLAHVVVQKWHEPEALASGRKDTVYRVVYVARITSPKVVNQSWHMADRLRPPRARMGRVREALLAMASIQVWVGRHACNLTR